MISYVLSAYSFDIGDVLAVARCRIEPDELRPELESKLAKIGADLMLQVIKDMEFYRSNIEPQSEEQVTYGKLPSCLDLFLFKIKTDFYLLEA